MLKVHDLHAGYDDVLILRGVSLAVEEGQIVALIGANGAGKTTTLRAISALIPTRRGSITFDGQAIHDWPCHRTVEAGLVQVPEGRHLFGHMTVQENLELGSIRRGRAQRRDTMRQVFKLFPRLEERRTQLAGTLSGGEQQMLAIGRALMTHPRLLMLDEPSLGLAPLIVADIFRIIREIRKTGATVLIVEQNAAQTLAMADQAYVLENGEIVLQGSGDELLNNEQVRNAYLGM